MRKEAKMDRNLVSLCEKTFDMSISNDTPRNTFSIARTRLILMFSILHDILHFRYAVQEQRIKYLQLGHSPTFKSPQILNLISNIIVK